MGRFRTFPIARVILATRVVFRATYRIWLYSRTGYGLWSVQLGPRQDLTFIERIVTVLLLLLTFIGCFFGTAFLSGIAPFGL